MTGPAASQAPASTVQAPETADSPAPPVAPAGEAGGWAAALRMPIALIALSVVVTLVSTCFFVAEAVDLSNAGDVGASARVIATILGATSNLVLVLALVWLVLLLSRGSDR